MTPYWPSGATFDIRTTDADALADLRNLSLILEGGNELAATMEIAGQDKGPSFEGFFLNFALGTLTLGGEDSSWVQLIDNFDNQPDWGGSEALYVHDLNIGADSYLDLNGYNLYYLDGLIDPAATILYNGGNLIQLPSPEPAFGIPEPATLGLLIVGGLALLGRRRFLL